jgi:hypothetical protein
VWKPRGLSRDESRHAREDPLTQRLASQAMALAAGDVAGVAQWLVFLGGRITHQAEGEASLVAPSGVTVGLMPSDPVSCAIALGFAVGGEFWPLVYPGLLGEVNRRWRAQRRAAKEEPLC